MKHVTIADKSLLAGDEVVDLLIEYATLLGQTGSADHVDVDVAAIGPDGDDVLVTFLLNAGVSVVVESTHSATPEPDNTKAEEYMHDRVAHLRGLGVSSDEDVAGAAIWNTTPGE
ncbi:hypothetical protein [uncultured Amnibacterium sp.]|uniref:hypothetical protein n=1 Tax=uncultured Amnibacterium sp. TaxID=1631851 RepID=UPI0035CA89A1